MIDLRMVADDRGNLQLQYRRRDICVDAGGNLCDGGDWLEWKSVPIVHDPSQLVDRIEVFDAKTSGAKPDSGLTAAQVEELLRELEEDHATHSANFQRAEVNNETYSHQHQRGMAGGISVCLGKIRSKLSPQSNELELDEIKPSPTSVEDWVDAMPEHIMMVYNGEALKARFKKHETNSNWVSTDVDGYEMTLCGWDRGTFVDSAGEQWEACQVYCKRS